MLERLEILTSNQSYSWTNLQSSLEGETFGLDKEVSVLR